MTNKNIKIAVFDVCDTIYSANTTFYFLDSFFESNREYQRFRKFTKLYLVKVLNAIIYKITKKDLIRLYATRFLKGFSVDEIESYCKEFVANTLSKKEQKVIINKLKDYQQSGYKIVLMSGSYEFIVKEVASFYKADNYFASELEVENGFFLGRYKKDILLSKSEILKYNYDKFEELIVVSDNKSDLELMKMANKSFAVCNRVKDCNFWNQYDFVNQIKVFHV